MSAQDTPDLPGQGTSPTDLEWIRGLLRDVFVIEDVTIGGFGGRGIRLRGHFTMDTGQAYRLLAPQFGALGRTILFRRDGNGHAIWVLDDRPRAAGGNRWLPLVLGIATVISMLATHILMFGTGDLSWAGIRAGFPGAAQFTASLLAILLTHEMGHYFTARHFGVDVTPPYLIPFPLSPFGTMGAVIRMKSVPPSRRAMLLTGAAGPLAGLVVAVPLLIWGLSLSNVAPLPTGGEYMLEGNSLLYAALKRLILGAWLPAGGVDVNLHPMAFAGWAGLLVSALNMIPAGQLDGGHVAYALLGERARYLTYLVIVAMLVMAITWSGWLLWAVLIFALSRMQEPPLNDVTPLSRGEIGVAILLLVLFVLTFTPIPLRYITP